MTSLGSALIAVALFAVSYFDAHNHISGILPYEAYANLPAYIAEFSNRNERVGFDDRLALYRYLADVWYPSQEAALDDRLFSPADGQRYALGARGTLEVSRSQVAGSAVALNGTLERVLTATPWSEFDSAYAFAAARQVRTCAIVFMAAATTASAAISVRRRFSIWRRRTSTFPSSRFRLWADGSLHVASPARSKRSSA
jgi:hypothetical protein